MNNVDEDIMNRQKGEAAAGRAGDLKEAKRSDSAGLQESGESESGPSLRERTFKKKKKAKEGADGKEDDKAAGGMFSAISQWTSKLLQNAWLNLADSFGLTLIWIDIHVWLGSIFGHQFFCKLGQEWVDNNIVSAENEYAKSQGKTLGTVEPMVLACCNVGCFFLLLSIAMIIAMIVGVITNPLKAIAAAFGYLWRYFFGK